MNNFKRDVQEEKPKYTIGLNRVGIKNIEKIIRINKNGDHNLFCSNIDIYVDLLPVKKGVHMSRFDETLTRIIDKIIFSEVMSIENLATTIARQARESQDANCSEVKIKAKYPVNKETPVSNKKTQKINTIIGWAVSKKAGDKQLVGVETSGMTVCPCAQEMMEEYAQEKLQENDFSKEEISKILEIIPMVSHNQKGEGTLMLGTDSPVNADRLVEIIEESMSAQIIDLLKRPDEFELVKKAHFNPKFVEDVVRGIIHNVLDTIGNLDDNDYIYARQINYEGIHNYEVFAEKHGMVKEIMNEPVKTNTQKESYEMDRQNTSVRKWLHNVR